MSWYKKRYMVKSASGISGKDTGVVADEQEATSHTLFDVQRYVMDSYSVKTAFSRTGKKLSVTVLMNHNFLGSIAWDAYWSYGLNEFDRAASMYDKLNSATRKVADRFLEEEIPTPLFWTMLRAEIEMEDKGNQAASFIPSVNYSKDIPIEPDWRKNIYGPRYPQYSEPNYSQIVKFWATQRD